MYFMMYSEAQSRPRYPTMVYWLFRIKNTWEAADIGLPSLSKCREKISMW